MICRFRTRVCNNASDRYVRVPVETAPKDESAEHPGEAERIDPVHQVGHDPAGFCFLPSRSPVILLVAARRDDADPAA